MEKYGCSYCIYWIHYQAQTVYLWHTFMLLFQAIGQYMRRLKNYYLRCWRIISSECFLFWHLIEENYHRTQELDGILNILCNPFILYMQWLPPREINLWCILDFVYYILLSNSLCGLGSQKFSVIKIKRDYAQRIADDSISQGGKLNWVLVFYEYMYKTHYTITKYLEIWRE